MKKQGLKKVLSSVMICVLLLSQGISGFAAADPTENTVIQHLTDGWTDSKSAGGLKNFSAIDENDTNHGTVKWFSYSKESIMAAEKVWEEEVLCDSKDKLVSFDLYIYDNTIPYEIRFYDGNSGIGNKLGEININFFSNQNNQGMSAVSEKAKIGVNASATEVLSLNNKEWHKVEVVFSEGKCHYYINGINIGSNNHGLVDSYFTGYQIVSRKGNQAESVGEKSGIYLDNFKSVVYGDNAQFYGKASVVAGDIKVEFSESVSSTFTAGFSGVKVYNTKTGKVVDTEVPILSGNILTIPANETLKSATEYMIYFPNKPVGISGKTLYSNIYFYIAGGKTAKECSENFNSYEALTGNTSDVIAVDPKWISQGRVNIKDFSEDADAENAKHEKVVYGRNTTSELKLRWGIKANEEIDTTKGEASVEFDVKIPNYYYQNLIVQPYSTMDGVTEEKTLVDSGSHGSGQMTGKQNHFASFTIMGNNGTDYAGKYNNGNPYIVFNNYNNSIYIDKYEETDKINIVSLNKDEWHTVKLTIDNTKTVADYTVIKLYVDGSLQATNTADISGSAVTNILKGIRFNLKTFGEDTASEKILIDNVKFTYFGDEEINVEKVRIFDLNYESYGPMATDIPASSECAKIKLTKAIASAEDVVVSVSDGSNSIGSDVSLSADGTVLTAIFDDMLKVNTNYTLSVSGSEFVGSSVSFTTSDSNELVIYNLRITDESGNTLPENPTTTGTYYVKAKVINATNMPQTALILGAVYNDNSMKDVNFKEVVVRAYSKTDDSEISIPITVVSCDNLSLSAMAWESFDTCKPIEKAIEY